MEGPLSDSVDDLLRKMKITAGARFNADKRLRRTDRWTTVLMSFSSAYLIILSVTPYVISVDSFSQKWLGFFTIAISVLLLALSVLSYSGAYTSRAERFHSCALELQEIRRTLKFEGDEISKNKFEEI
jgi:uncharacterized membrane protein